MFFLQQVLKSKTKEKYVPDYDSHNNSRLLDQKIYSTTPWLFNLSQTKPTARLQFIVIHTVIQDTQREFLGQIPY